MADDTPEITELLKRVCRGESEALGELCVSQRRVFMAVVGPYVARKRLPTATEEDLLQDCYLDLIVAMECWVPGRGSIGNLAWSIARSACSWHRRRERVQLSSLPLFTENNDGEESEEKILPDQIAADEWVVDNSPGRVDPPLSVRRGSPQKWVEPPPAKKPPRKRRLSAEELERRAAAREEWARV